MSRTEQGGPKPEIIPAPPPHRYRVFDKSMDMEDRIVTAHSHDYGSGAKYTTFWLDLYTDWELVEVAHPGGLGTRWTWVWKPVKVRAKAFVIRTSLICEVTLVQAETDDRT